jgi:uncharacterized protein YjbI with pentapeptide repeats
VEDNSLFQDFSNQNLTDLSFENANLEGVSFRGATINKVCFKDANLLGCNFSEATIVDSSFEGAQFGCSSILETEILLDSISTSFWIFASYLLGDSNSLYGHSLTSSVIAILFLLSSGILLALLYLSWLIFARHLVINEDIYVLFILGFIALAFSANFLNKKVNYMKSTRFTNSKLTRVKFTSSDSKSFDISGASFVECNLEV